MIYRIGEDLICFAAASSGGASVPANPRCPEALVNAHLMSLNFSSASADGFLSGWY